MPLLEKTDVACPIPLLGARGVEITFPGGAKIGAMVDRLYASEAELARSLLGQAQLVLAPLKPIFDILAAVLAIVKILEAVPSVVTNPKKFLDELTGAAKQFAALAQLIPQLSGPIFVGHILDLVIKVLLGFVAELDQIALKQADIDKMAQELIDENDPLAMVLDCARKLNETRLCAVDEAMAPLSPIFELINIFMKLLGLPPIEALGPLGHDAFGARTAIMDLVTLLQGIRQGLPTPPMSWAPRC